MRVIYLLCIVISILSCKEISQKELKPSVAMSEHFEIGKKTNRILIVVSNEHTYGTSKINTANHFAEIVLAYDVFQKEGFQVDFVSPKGGAIPIGYISTSNKLQKSYLYDCDFMSMLKNTKKPTSIDPAKYKAIYYGGGGAAMYGVPEDVNIQKIAMEIYEIQNGVVAAICHGTAGLVNLKKMDGSYLYEGKRINGFPDLFENMQAEYYKQFPFSIEQTIKNRGGNFEYSKEGWDNYFEVDGRLITGQDPSSTVTVAKKIVEALNKIN